MTLPKISHSQIVLWRECQQRWGYRYGQRLVRKRAERPLFLGNWVHSMLEAHYGGGDWKKAHGVYVRDYNRLFDEEQERLDRGNSKSKGPWEPLPSQAKRIMESYLWYHRNERARTLAVEVEFELKVTSEVDGLEYILKGVIDRIKEDEDGLIWVEDHKVWTDIPDENAFHTMDPQLTIYLHGAKEALGVEAAGIEYNYLTSKAPTIPKLNKDGSISRAEVLTDYPTLFRFLKKNGFDPKEYLDLLGPLATTSPFLKRHRFPRSEIVTRRILRDFDISAHEILAHTETVRNITRQCSWCQYEALCRAELFGLDTSYMRKNDFEIESRGKKPTPV